MEIGRDDLRKSYIAYHLAVRIMIMIIAIFYFRDEHKNWQPFPGVRLGLKRGFVRR